MDIFPNQQKLIKNFSRCQNWEEKYLYMMELGAMLTPLTEEQRQPKNLITGCQSQVWIVMQQDSEGKVLFFGDSDAAIVKGLIAMVFILCHNMSLDEMIKLDAHSFFTDLALTQHLTPSRSEGLSAMVEAIRAKAALISTIRV
ncbi:cysteine desulfuration protein SufE [Candidatus Williamhamiltonella defendens]|uniref:cysteine desulfuration protein SufE n=1 Tax=Candidatus Williamhamiltonella defendens TaxID=138072 RepID=UPI00130DF128|nr:cysteine desulfuration protein SufE [Candidatus Hamiltonella defensa]